MTIWFTSDLHFGHKNILKYNPEYRPYSTVEEMTAGLIASWNATVSDTDTVYHLGDFCFRKKSYSDSIISQLRGNIVFIRGNHDQFGDPYKEIKVNKQTICLFHYPMMSWNKMHYGSWHLHGHCHGSLKHQTGKLLDVGWDAHGKLLSFDNVKEILDTRAIVVHDHHIGKEI